MSARATISEMSFIKQQLDALSERLDALALAQTTQAAVDALTARVDALCACLARVVEALTVSDASSQAFKGGLGRV